MHLPLIIAIVAFLALALLPVLDLSAILETDAQGIRSYVKRIARWAQE